MSANDRPAHSPLTPEQSESLSLGTITIDNAVISTLATQAASKLDGVRVVESSFRLAEFLGRESSHKGVSVKPIADSGHVEINVAITVAYGMVIYDAARDLQLLVKEEVEALTGSLNVDKVNVTVRKVVAAQEEEPRETVPPDQAYSAGLEEEEGENL